MTDTPPPARCSRCSCCGEPRDRPGQYYCSKCNAAYQRAWQADQRRLLRQIKGSGLSIESIGSRQQTVQTDD
jgi:hypothetical protein